MVTLFSKLNIFFLELFIYCLKELKACLNKYENNGMEPLCKCLTLPTFADLEMVFFLSVSPHKYVLEQKSVNYGP